MRIVLDLQACQGESRYRGIGRYSLALAKAMLRGASDRHEFWVVANSGFGDESVEWLRHELSDLLPQGRFLPWRVCAPTAARDPARNEVAFERAVAVRQALLDRLHPDFVHVASLFEGMDDASVQAVSADPAAAPVAVTLYDLVPLINRTSYLRHPNGIDWYYRHLDSLRRARLLLAISESSRREAIDALDWPPDRVLNISAAIDSSFRPLPHDGARDADLRRRFHLTRPFVLSAGVAEARKNIDALIRAFALLPEAVRNQHQLVLVGTALPEFHTRFEQLIRDCGLAPDAVLMTGYVADADLVGLYNLCKLFVLPSWHEGFGLPVLEAMTCGAPAIAANASSLPEVIGRADALFDPHSDDSIRDLMLRALLDDGFRADLAASGLIRAKRFSWDRTAQRALAAMEAAAVAPAPVAPTYRKPRLAWFALGSVAGTARAHAAVGLLVALADHYDIEVIADGPVEPAVPVAWPVRSRRWFAAHAGHYQRVLYQASDLPLPPQELALVRNTPGTLLLHHATLDEITAWVAHQPMPEDAIRALVYRGWGYQGLLQATGADGVQGLLARCPAGYAHAELAQGIAIVDEPGNPAPAWLPGERAARMLHHIAWLPSPTMGAGSAREAWRTQASMFHDAIERFRAEGSRARLVAATADLVARTSTLIPEPGDVRRAVQALADALPPALAARQLLVDVSDPATAAAAVIDTAAIARTSIAGLRVEPVYAQPAEGFHRYARRSTLAALGLPPIATLADDPIDVAPGDVFLVVASDPAAIQDRRQYFAGLRERGTRIVFALADVPTPENAHGLAAVASLADRVVMPSRDAAAKMRRWLDANHVRSPHDLDVAWSGADTASGAATAKAFTPAEMASRLLRACLDEPVDGGVQGGARDAR